MNSPQPELILTTSPYTHTRTTTPGIMREVLLLLLPVLGFAVWTFGLGALLVVLTATLSCVATEWFFLRGRKPTTLLDGSAVLTGVLLGLTLPPGFPLWMTCLGGFAAMGLGKLIWGGLGQNLFNPALVGRAFLQAAFPTAITTWHLPRLDVSLTSLPPSLFTMPLMHPLVDALTGATPLRLAKYESQITGLKTLLVGNVGGSIGETSAGLLLLCGIWLAARRIFEWRLMVSTILGTAIFSGLLELASLYAPGMTTRHIPGVWFMLTSGGLMLAAVFMVTDPVTTPTTTKGAWIFGFGVGFLVVLIRVFGGLDEGVMYAILLLNAVVPHLNRYTQPRRFGG